MASNARISPVGNVFYFVDDLEAGITWYQQLLGVEPDRDGDRLARFDIDGTILTVHRFDEFNSSSGTKGPVTYWNVDDVDALLTELESRGGKAHRGPKTIFTGERLL